MDERGKVDPEQAGPAMRDCINKSQSRKARKARGMAETEGGESTGLLSATSSGPIAEKDITQIRREREEAELALTKLKLGQAEGALVDKAVVEIAQFNLARALRNSLQGIPARVADQLAAETDPVVVRRILDAEIRHSLEGAATVAAEMAGMDETTEPEAPAQEVEA